MNVGTTNLRAGRSATTVVRLGTQSAKAGQAENRGISVEQREPRSISAFLPQVLARYGLNASSCDAKPTRQLDLFA